MPLRCSARSAQAVEGVDAADPRPAQRLGLPAARPVPDPGQRRERAVARPAAGREACARRGSTRRRPRRRSRPPRRGPCRGSAPTDRHQSRGTPSTPDQACSITTPRRRGNIATQLRAQARDGRGGRLARAVGARAEAIGDAAPADRDAPVGGALQVDVDVRAVARASRCSAQPISCHLARAQRLGDDHRAVHRHERSRAARAARRCSPRSRERPSARAPRPAGVQRLRARGSRCTGVRSWISTPSAATASASAGEQLRGMHARDVRGEARAARARHAHRSPRARSRAELAQVLLRRARRARAGRRLAQARRAAASSSATASCPPFTQVRVDRSCSASTRPTSSTVCEHRPLERAQRRRARRAARTRARARRRSPRPSRRCARRRRSPATSRSSTTIRSAGSARLR